MLSLVGPLGAGKTEFVRGLTAGVGARADRVASPTFTIAHLYPPRGAGAAEVAHFDLYRIHSEAELEAVGFADFLVPGTVVAVEWGERCVAALPRDHLALHFARRTADERELTARAGGPRATAWCADWCEHLARSGWQR